MEDIRITELYWQRKESAITESERKYGAYCGVVAYNILHSYEDSDECVNDTWLRAWETIPPEKPKLLAAFFGKITRNLAIDRFRKDKAKKYGGGQVTLCLDELAECIGEDRPVEDRLVLKQTLEAFLKGIPEKNRDIFLLRYFYLMPVAKIAARYHTTEGAVKMLLKRVRRNLKDTLEKEGIGI